MKKIISVDCDEVLSETIDAILKYYKNNINGNIIKKNEMTSHDLNLIKKYHISLKDRLETEDHFFRDSNSIKLIKPVEGAKEKLSEFKKMGYKIYIVTGRPDWLKEHTFKWTEKYYGDIIDDIYFCNLDFPTIKTPKSKICKEIGAKFMIEDDSRFAQDIAINGIKTYLIDKPWNREFKTELKNIIRVNNWSEVKI